MDFEGVLSKMDTHLDEVVNYYLQFPRTFLHVNTLIDRNIHIKHIGYECLNCSKTKPVFRQGFCYDCFMSSPAVGDWIMRPELSKAHLDIEDRDLAYEKRIQLQPHVVYFAVASDLKIGVTRKTQIPTRWIDQGASYAFPIVELPNRYLAGITEVALKNYFTDKTNWRKMLTNQQADIDYKLSLHEVQRYLPEEVLPYFEKTTHNKIDINYPVLQYPTKLTSLNLTKTSEFSGKLKGIRGQYLIFEDGCVFNVRSHEGFKIVLTT